MLCGRFIFLNYISGMKSNFLTFRSSHMSNVVDRVREEIALFQFKFYLCTMSAFAQHDQCASRPSLKHEIVFKIDQCRWLFIPHSSIIAKVCQTKIHTTIDSKRALIHSFSRCEKMISIYCLNRNVKELLYATMSHSVFTFMFVFIRFQQCSGQRRSHIHDLFKTLSVVYVVIQ